MLSLDISICSNLFILFLCYRECVVFRFISLSSVSFYFFFFFLRRLACFLVRFLSFEINYNYVWVSCRPTFVKIWKRKAVEDFSGIPYLATVLNCMLWVFYGLPFVHPNSTLIVTINVVGLVLEAIYLTIFFTYAPNRSRVRSESILSWLSLLCSISWFLLLLLLPLQLKVLKILAVELVFMGAVIAGVIAGVHTHKKRTFIVGILCVIFGTCMYASPLSIMVSITRLLLNCCPTNHWWMINWIGFYMT